jgi:hypothetical protein
MDLLKILSRKIAGMTEENHEKPQSGQPFSGPGYEPGIYQIRGGSTDHLIMMLNIWKQTDFIIIIILSSTGRTANCYNM